MIIAAGRVGLFLCPEVVLNKPKDLKNVICPQCGEPFRLMWNDYTKTGETIQTVVGLSRRPVYYAETLILRGCPSGGIYDVLISCPHCDYEEEL